MSSPTCLWVLIARRGKSKNAKKLASCLKVMLESDEEFDSFYHISKTPYNMCLEFLASKLPKIILVRRLNLGPCAPCSYSHQIALVPRLMWKNKLNSAYVRVNDAKYDLKVVSRCAFTSAVSGMQCLFYIMFGCEKNVGAKRKLTINVQGGVHHFATTRLSFT